jgi:hypothetical protein
MRRSDFIVRFEWAARAIYHCTFEACASAVVFGTLNDFSSHVKLL